jgi:hypothetical protein
MANWCEQLGFIGGVMRGASMALEHLHGVVIEVMI